MNCQNIRQLWPLNRNLDCPLSAFSCSQYDGRSWPAAAGRRYRPEASSDCDKRCPDKPTGGWLRQSDAYMKGQSHQPSRTALCVLAFH
jgi:hypothetical protein